MSNPLYGAPQVPGPHPWMPSGPRRRRAGLIHAAKPDARAFLGAGIAVVGVIAVMFVSSLMYLFGVMSYQSAGQADPTGDVPVRDFIDGWLTTPFMFYVGAFAVLVFLAPIVQRIPVQTVVLRAVLAGAGGTLLLAVLGVFTGFTNFVRNSDPSYIWTDIVTTPLWLGTQCTAMLIAGAVVAWLILARLGSRPSPSWRPGASWAPEPPRTQWPQAPGAPRPANPADAPRWEQPPGWPQAPRRGDTENGRQ